MVWIHHSSVIGIEAGYILAIVCNTVLDMNMQKPSWCADLDSLMHVYTGVV